MNWYTIENIDRIDTPCLVLYNERIKSNISAAVRLIKNVDNLRPHVKTNKIAEVCRMMMDNGITKFKCSTIAEAEMLAMLGTRDVLLAYQPVGPKVDRFLQLVQKYSAVSFSCLTDNSEALQQLSAAFSPAQLKLNVF